MATTGSRVAVRSTALALLASFALTACGGPPVAAPGSTVSAPSILVESNGLTGEVDSRVTFIQKGISKAEWRARKFRKVVLNPPDMPAPRSVNAWAYRAEVRCIKPDSLFWPQYETQIWEGTLDMQGGTWKGRYVIGEVGQPPSWTGPWFSYQLSELE